MRYHSKLFAIHTFQTKYYSDYKINTKKCSSPSSCIPAYCAIPPKFPVIVFCVVMYLCCICIVFLLYLYYKPGLRSISQCHKTKISCGEVQAMQSSGSHHETQVPSKDYFGRPFWPYNKCICTKKRFIFFLHRLI